MSLSSPIRLGFALSIVLFSCRGATAQLPATRLDAVFPAGGSPGTTIEVTLAGNDLDDVDQLLFSHDGIVAKQKTIDPGPFDEGPQPVENVFLVTIDANTPPGNYAVRCRGKYGLSGPRTFVVDRRDELQVVEIESNQDATEAIEIAALPAVIHGQFNARGDADWYRFHAAKGRRLLIEGFARRIDSDANLALALSTVDGRILAASRRAVAGDPLLDVDIPADGEYLLSVKDELFGGGANFPYRIVVDAPPVIDFVFPPAGTPGSTSEYTVYGRNLPGGQPSAVTLQGRPLEEVRTTITVPETAEGDLRFSGRLDAFQAGVDGFEFRLDTPSGPTNPVLLGVATAPVVQEQGDNDTPQTAQPLAIPCEVAGQFYPQRDVDWYSFQAKQGEELWLELYSHRLGAPTDVVLVVQRVEIADDGAEKVTQVAWVDDSREREGGIEFDERSNDPVYRFQAPADGLYRVLVRDGRSALVEDPSLVYRFALRRARPDFRLAAAPIDASGEILLRKGGREAVRVVVFRQDGYDGEIHVRGEGLPPGVSASEIIIGPGSETGWLVLEAAEDAEPSLGLIQIIGRAKREEQDVERTARLGRPTQAVPFAQLNNRNQASLACRLTDSLPLVIADHEAELLSIQLKGPSSVKTSRGAVLTLEYSVARQDKVGGNINAFPIGMPNDFRAPQIGLGGKEEGEFQLRLPGNMTAGTYTMCLGGMVQGASYARNPEAAAKAKERKERIDRVYEEVQQQVRQQQQAVADAQSRLNQSNTELARRLAEQKAADMAAQSSAEALKSATETLSRLEQRIAADPADESLPPQMQAAKAAVEKAAEVAAQAEQEANLAGKARQEAEAAQKAAVDSKTAADQASLDAQQLLQEAQRERQRADQRARLLAQQANPRGLNYIVPSNTITLEIAEFPIDVAVPDVPLRVVQGEKFDIPVTISRLYGFEEQVSLQASAPQGVSGLQIANLSLAKDKTEAKLSGTAQANATLGEHEAKLQATLTFNGQRLTLERTIKIEVRQADSK